MNEQHTRLHMTGAVKRKQIFKTLRRQKLIQNSFARLVWEWFFALQQQMTAWALKSSLDKAQPIVLKLIIYFYDLSELKLWGLSWKKAFIATLR